MDKPLPDDFDPYGGIFCFAEITISLSARRPSDDERDEYGYPKGIKIAASGDAKIGSAKSRFDSIIDALLIAGIIALVSATVLSLVTATELKTAFVERNEFYDREISRAVAANERQDTELKRHDERLDRLEQQRGFGERDDNNQQRSRR